MLGCVGLAVGVAPGSAHHLYPLALVFAASFVIVFRCHQDAEAHERRPWDMLKAVDSTFTVAARRNFHARNARADEVEILVAPSRAGTLDGCCQPRPVPYPEQERLLLGRLVDHVIDCRDGLPACTFAPDSR